MNELPPHTPAPVCFADTETDSLKRRRRPWEIGIVRREPDGTEKTYNLMIADVDLSHADPIALNIGRFFERHPRFGGTLPEGSELVTDEQAALLTEEALRGAHIIGGVPHFDEHVFKHMFRRHKLPWSAHYHLGDFENMIVGYLAGISRWQADRLDGLTSLRPPWSSEQLSRVLGIDPPAPHARHTALGDALWARAVYDHIITEQQAYLDEWRAARAAHTAA